MASEPGGEIVGRFYPAASSRRIEAQLVAAPGGTLIVTGKDGSVLGEWSAARTDIADRIGSTPRFITFADGSTFETLENDRVDALIAGRRSSVSGFIHDLERFHPRLALVVAAVALLAFGLYRLALPVMVEIAVLVTPPALPQLMSAAALESLDRTVFSPSDLPVPRRAAIEKVFGELAQHGKRGVGGYTLRFRDGGAIGPNAFALPDGTLVLTDQLVALAGEKLDPVAGVLAHEIGHVDHEHSLRQLYRLAGVTGLILLVGGDIGAGAEDLLIQGTALLALSHSRANEAEADRYSVRLMARAGRNPAAIAEFFEILRDRYSDRSELDFLSTHPATPARIREIRRLAEELAIAGE